MRKTFLAIALISACAYAQCPPETSLFFGNGMFNSRDDAQKSLIRLSQGLTATDSWNKDLSFLAYNFDEPAVMQLLEMLDQKKEDFDSRFWRWLSNPTDSPSWFQTELQKMQAREDLQGFAGLNLNEQVLKYEVQMSKGRSVVVVAHSQGNFFANSAATVLAAEFYPVQSDFKLISVATPSSFVYNDGPHFTLKSDGVIRWVPGAMSANIENSSPTPGFFDHEFVRHYLDGIPTGEQILSIVQGTLQKLGEDAKSSYNNECWKWFESLNLPKDDSMECTIKCNAVRNDMSNFMCAQYCETYCGCTQRKPN